jgi:hypothetical protein
VRGETAAQVALQVQGLLYNELMLSLLDNFWVMAAISFGVTPLLFLMKKVKPGARRAPIH